MAKAPSAPLPQAPLLSAAQMQTAINRFRRRVADLEGFDPQTVRSRSDPNVRPLEVAIDETLAEAFGHRTPEYNRYAAAAHLDRAAVNLIGAAPLSEIIKGLFEGKAQAIALLNQAIRSFEEKLADLGHGTSPLDFGRTTGLEELLASTSELLTCTQETAKERSAPAGTHVFIGHGRSTAWRDLKDFIQDRVGLPYDEFNRVPVAGITNTARLSDMLDSAAVAFIVLTAEDEQADGKMHARLNAVHEAGLFQGRLGFKKAILLLEEGCEEFSNIQGLGQIRYPKGNIAAKFEEIRRVLEREGVID